MREKFYSLTEKLKNILKSLYGFGGHLAAFVHDKLICNDQFYVHDVVYLKGAMSAGEHAL